MTGRAIGDRWRIAGLVTRHAARRALRLATAPVRVLLPGPRGGSPDRLVIAPQDLRTTDPTVANDIYAGYFAFAGKVVPVSGISPFRVPPPSEAWSEALMGFGWLRHLRAADSALARANARALVDDWISEAGRSATGPAWRPEVVSRRLISWLTQSPLILEGADRTFYRRFLKSLGRQTVWLARTTGDMPDAEAKLFAAIALAYVALCTQASVSQFRRASRLLGEQLDRQILPDGGHVGRNPQTLVDLLTDLLPLRQAYASQGIEPPRGMLNAIDRMMPALRLFRHGDGSLALFNGMSVSPPDRLATLLAYTDARVQPIENAPHSGYQRLQARRAVVVLDAGPPPPPVHSDRAHAGCLSFEFSDGTSRIVVNCGAPPPGAEPWRALARATAAHSTVTIADTSSCRFVDLQNRGGLGTPIIAGPGRVTMEREVQRGPAGPGPGVVATHDGYEPAFGVVHQRRLVLEADGRRLLGEDRLIVTHQGRGVDDTYAVRFHLHPSVRASRAADGVSVYLDLPDGRTWIFRAGGLPTVLEESIFFATPDGARATEQIVVAGGFRAQEAVSWSFEREDAGRPDEDPDAPVPQD
ncbi:heparinase II/III family protein [Alsobacter sp. R-9]